MTAIEVFHDITSTPKWYAGYITAQNATNIKSRFRAGKLQFTTLEKMFNHYGYFISNNSPWIKK